MRHAEGIVFKNFKVSYKEDDFRPAFVFDDVKGIEMTEVDILSSKELPVVLLNNTSKMVIKSLRMPVSNEMGIQKTNNK